MTKSRGPVPEKPAKFLLFFFYSKRGRKERGEQREELSILPTRTGILRILHVSGLGTHWQRERAPSLAARKSCQANMHLYMDYAPSPVFTTLPRSFRNNL